MEKLRSDSPLCRRLVSAFLDFLSSVDPAPDVDLEGLEVARECLQEVFKLDSNADKVPSGLLVDLFRSADINKESENKSDSGHATVSTGGPSMVSAQTSANDNPAEGESPIEGSPISGFSNDELFGQFCGALERIRFFNPTPDGDDDHAQLSKAKRMFDDALMEMGKSGNQVTSVINLAETLKSLGNRGMQSKLYTDALEYYTCAIALCENNAVYYCNRAAAYTQIHNYAEAVSDCKKAIRINPNYSKAYSRLGMAYYGQGNYMDAINLGYLKALELDPNNRSIHENIRVAEQKLREEHRGTGGGQNSGHGRENGPNNQSSGSSRHSGNGVPPPFTFPANFPANFPGNLAEILINTTANAHSGAQGGFEGADDSSTDGSGPNEPEIRMGGNVSFNFAGDVLPEDISSAVRSVMGMFSSPNGPEGNLHRDSNSTPH